MRQSLNHLGIIQVIVNYYVNVYYPYNLDKSYYVRNCIGDQQLQSMQIKKVHK